MNTSCQACATSEADPTNSVHFAVACTSCSCRALAASLRGTEPDPSRLKQWLASLGTQTEFDYWAERIRRDQAAQLTTSKD